MKPTENMTPFTIGVFSSSSPISATTPVRYERGKAYLQKKGFRVLDGSLYGKVISTVPGQSGRGQRSLISFCIGKKWR